VRNGSGVINRTTELHSNIYHSPRALRELTLNGGNMPGTQDSDDDVEDITDEIDENENIEDFLDTMEVVNKAKVVSNLTARRRIEELLEERRLREQIEDYTDRDLD